MTKIGDSSLDVYPLCLGTNTFGWTADAEQSTRVLDDYFAAGGNFLDTADVYSAWVPGNRGGESEEIIGAWLAKGGHREQIVLATKVAKLAPNQGLSRQSILSGVEASLQRLQTDYIDLYYAHAEDLSVPVEESVAAFAQLAADGKIRQVGLSNHSPQRVEEWISVADDLGVARPVALQPHYNLLTRREFESALQPIAKTYNLAVMPYYALASGLLTGKYLPGQDLAGGRSGTLSGYAGERADRVIEALRQIADEHNVEPAAVALAWLLEQPTVTAPIASARVREQLPALLEGVSIVLQDQELELLDSLSEGMPVDDWSQPFPLIASLLPQR